MTIDTSSEKNRVGQAVPDDVLLTDVLPSLLMTLKHISSGVRHSLTYFMRAAKSRAFQRFPKLLIPGFPADAAAGGRCGQELSYRKRLLLDSNET